MIEQKELIEDFIKQDRFLLIVLDACRYDIVNDLIGDTKPCRSNALNTQWWFKRTWPDFYDLTYLSATPRLGEHDWEGYSGTDHFSEVVEVWDTDWDEEYGTLLPSTMAERYKEINPNKAVVHFIQPHAPYLIAKNEEVQVQGDEYNNNKVKDIANQVGREKLKDFYFENFETAWKNGVREIADMSPNTVVTADHGEQLGENGNYGHNNPDCSVLREVPWYECKSFSGQVNIPQGG